MAVLRPAAGRGRVTELRGHERAEADAVSEFRDAVLRGLSLPQKRIPSKYFYDAEGSRLFEQITELDEYYLTRTELALLRECRDEIAARIGPGARLIEFGAGSLQKIRILLESVRDLDAFVPIDISKEHLMAAASALSREFPHVPIRPVVADFTRPVRAATLGSGRAKQVAFFPGSTIGNFSPDAAAAFLATIAQTVGSGGELLIGVDLKKDEEILFRAYNDSAGVTAAFNRNLLVRINRELAGDFDPSSFDHHAPYNAEEGRMEMHLVSRGAQTVRVAGRTFAFRERETIHTENSYKYTVDEVAALGGRGGFSTLCTWTDPTGLFSMHYLRAI